MTERACLTIFAPRPRIQQKLKSGPQAKALVNRLMASSDRRNSTRLAAQARLIEDYERRRWPRRLPATADVLSYLMEQHGLSRADLVPLLGTVSRVS
jgi:HTH-type transcriptional regulator/antitoxin HigA